MRLVARLIPAVVFLGVVGLHFGWFAYFGPQTRWLPLDDDTSGLPIRAYLESQEPWLGLSYALSIWRRWSSGMPARSTWPAVCGG